MNILIAIFSTIYGIGFIYFSVGFVHIAYDHAKKSKHLKRKLGLYIPEALFGALIWPILLATMK